MPVIRSSAELRNNYKTISDLCHKRSDPVFITKNGQGDLAVMSIEAYDKLQARLEMYAELLQGLKDIDEGRIRPAADVMAEIRGKIS